jgi:serine/threonine protein kinase
MPDGTEPLALGSGTIVCLLGSGGAANVYKIWNQQLETYRAVKLLRPDLSQQWRKRFQTEMKIMAALSHPNIIEIHTVGVWNSLDFIEMEQIEGSTLEDMITGKGALPTQVCTAVAVMVARALAHAHDQRYVLFGKMYHGIIHRDIKPSNIMVSRDGRVKLMDFGVARPISASLLTTVDGGVVGTVPYMAPEQLNGADVDVTADIYALGTILYEMLTGEKAFPHINLSDLFEAKTKNEFVPLRLFNIPIPKRLKKLVNSCMSFNPTDRPQSASALLDEFELIHFSISHESCETAIESFMHSSGKERTILFARNRYFTRSIAWALAAIIAVAAIVFVTASLKTRTSTPMQVSAPPQVQPFAQAPVAQIPAAVPAEKLKPVAVSLMNKKTAIAAPSHQRRSYFDEAKARLGLSDPLEVITKEAEAGNYAGVLRIFGDLPPEVAADPVAQLFQLRALYALGKTIDAAKILNGPVINDGEFYLIKAKIACNQGNVDQSLLLLDKSLAVRAYNLDAETLRRDFLFWRAQCLTRRFDAAPADANRRDALDAWFEVKNAVRKNPAHEYFGKAVSEMQRIGEASSHDK